MIKSHKNRQAGASDVFLIILIYACFGSLWILLSDMALKTLIQDAHQFAVASVFKGWLFVAITSLLLFVLLSRYKRSLKPADAGAIPILTNHRHCLPFILLTLFIVGAGIGGITYHWQQQQREEFASLQAIAELKAAQITDWLTERQHGVEYIRSNAHFAELFRRWLNSADAAAAAHLQAWIGEFGQSMDYAATLFFDPQGRKLWASQGMKHEVAPILITAVQEAIRDGTIRRVGPYRDSDDHIYLDFVVPIQVDRELAAVVLHTDPTNWLYPTLQKWPGRSASGETLIFRRDAGDVLYLNQLRHRQDSALKLRLPIASQQLVAAQLARGAKQPHDLIFGVDYRGEPSVGIGYAISGTDWFLITKKDSTEFYDKTIKESASIAITCMLVLIIGGTLLTLQHQRGQLALAEERRRTEKAVQLQAEVLAHITEGVNVVAAEDGRILFVNAAFAATFGYQADELVGCNVAILNAPTTEHTPEATAATIIAQIHATGRWQGEVLNRRKDGSIFWTYAMVTSHIMPVWGNVWLSVQSDITARKVAEVALNQRNESLERFNRATIGRELDMVAMKRQINTLTLELGREPPYSSTALNSMEPWQPEDQQQAQLAMINLLEDAQAARDEATAIAATLRESERRLLMAQEGAHIGIWEWDMRNGSLYWSPEYERLYGVPVGSLHNYEDWRSRVYPDDLKLIDAEWERHIDRDAPFDAEFRIRREDTGETRWMYCVGSARRDENGKAIILSGINIDITDRKNVEVALLESEQRYRTLTDNLPGVVYRCEIKPPWRLMMISDGVKLLTGHKAKEFLSGDTPLAWGELVVAEDITNVEQNVDVAVAGRQSYRIEYRIRHADGGIRWILEHGRAIYDAEGTPEFLDGVITDMTSQKQAEEQLRARNAELERFNRIAIGREMDIIEMKKRINALSQELGHEPPYKLVFLNHDETGET